MIYITLIYVIKFTNTVLVKNTLQKKINKKIKILIMKKIKCLLASFYLNL